jgi:hypothetical protein
MLLSDTRKFDKPYVLDPSGEAPSRIAAIQFFKEI